ncbi:MAG: hypothetical protein J6D87_09910 [Clostridia bacterium]|nr:hypothetical protein [Clostridia bacterium]
MSKAAKFLAPVTFALSCLLGYGLVALLFTRVSDLGGAILATVIYGAMILTVFLLAVPAYCFLYGFKLLRFAKRKPLLVLYNALVLTLGYLLPFCTEDETYLYSLILFLWAGLWSALPLLFQKRK